MSGEGNAHFVCYTGEDVNAVRQVGVCQDGFSVVDDVGQLFFVHIQQQTDEAFFRHFLDFICLKFVRKK